MVCVTMKTKRPINNQNGGAAVEFALILPVLIFLIFVIVEGGLFLYNQHIITNASREGTRAGIVATSTPEGVSNAKIEEVVIKYAKAHLITFGSDTLDDGDIDIASQDDFDDTNGACVCSEPDPATEERCLTFGCDLVVDVFFNYDFLVLSVPYFGGFGPIKMQARTIMRME